MGLCIAGSRWSIIVQHRGRHIVERASLLPAPQRGWRSCSRSTPGCERSIHCHRYCPLLYAPIPILDPAHLHKIMCWHSSSHLQHYMNLQPVETCERDTLFCGLQREESLYLNRDNQPTHRPGYRVYSLMMMKELSSSLQHTG